MDSKARITIAYSGSLRFYDGKEEKRSSSFYVFQNDNVDFNTRSCWYLFNAVKNLMAQGRITPSDIHFDFWGAIDERNIGLAKTLGIEEFVSISGFVSKQESMKRLENSDVLFLPLESSKHGQKPLFIPGKIFDYLLVGKPIFALMEDSDCKDIVAKSGLGIFAHPAHVDEIADGILFLVKHAGDLHVQFKPDNAYIQSFRMEKKTGELASIFNKVLRKP